MKILASISIILLIVLVSLPASARRGNPQPIVSTSSAPHEFYVIDSDDDDSRKPIYNFVDTLFGTWHRVTGFNGSYDSYAETKATDSITYWHSNRSLRLPPRYISTSGLVKLSIDTFYTTPVSTHNNVTLGISTTNTLGAIVCPLWGNTEFRTIGDSSKVFYRMTSDSCYVTYYNLFLKGTNGTVSATFQIAFSRADSSIAYNYRSFDGSLNGKSAASIFQNVVTIGVQNAQGVYSTVYLDRGLYFAKSYNTPANAQNLHDGLAVKFIRVIPNFIQISSIDFPTYDGYELPLGNFQPKIKIENFTTQGRLIMITNKVVNLATGIAIYTRLDSAFVGQASEFLYTAPIVQGILCGATYRLTSTITVPALGDDGWTADNIRTRDVILMTPLSEPFYDDFLVLNSCNWHINGATLVDPSVYMFDQLSPKTSSAVLLNRKDLNGAPYAAGSAGDTITTAPLTLSGKTNVWLNFGYQRGIKTDSMKAGIKNRSLIGPEPTDLDSLGHTLSGDSLIVEALDTAGTMLNPLDTAWKQIASIDGGLDYTVKKFHVQIPKAYVHDHTRIRFRLASRIDAPGTLEDNDNWVIDEVQVSTPTAGKTDLEAVDVNLGNGSFTHLPRSVKTITPTVTITNNGLETTQGVYNLHLIIKDALGRPVYDMTRNITDIKAHFDTTIGMPLWNIQGSQGGVFTAKVQFQENFNEYRRLNDTNTFFRTMFIDDTYALDDGTADTAGTMIAPDAVFYYDFTPLASDSLRAFDFYHVDATGNANWTVNIFNSHDSLLTTRAISYVATDKGFVRATFTPYYLAKDGAYRLLFTLTQGVGFGGDASRGLMWESVHSFNSPVYKALYPNVVSKFRNSGNIDYLTAQRNASGGGPLLPMIRPVFQGSSTYLPVEIASLSATRTGLGSVSIAFQTAKEDAVHHFVIERESASGWISAGTVDAKNNNLGADYSLLDEKAPYSKQTYRLLEVDLDGTTKFVGTTTAAPFATSEAFAAYVNPNPASKNIHVTLTGTITNTTITIYDALGKVVAVKELAATTIADIDISKLSAGYYWLEARDGENTSRVKIAVSK